MAGAQVRFRCYKCNQLLGVSRNRIGSEVSCPKCATPLVVPDPEEMAEPAAPGSNPEPGPAATASDSPEGTPAFLSALAAGLPVEIADIRPEDIRVETSADWSPPLISTATQASAVEPYPLDVPPALPVEPPRRAPYEAAPAPASAPAPGPAPAPGAASVDSIVSAIKLEPPSVAGERTPAVRSRDLVLPRSVVAFWSLFVLLAQALAFLAGLLAGHFVWRVH